MIVDTHIHVGRFDDVYYDPLEIVETVMSCGIEQMWISSTTSCEEGIRYAKVETELQKLFAQTAQTPETVRALFWYCPDYIGQGVTAENAFGAIPYKGIKIHPYSHKWNFGDGRHMETLHGLFDLARRNDLPILIHTGESGIDGADRFESFFPEYAPARFVLAHCRPPETTLSMLEKYANVFCDTAFVPEAHIRQIVSAGHGEKLLTGTDFPITHFFSTHYPKENADKNISIKAQYEFDLAKIANSLHERGENTQHV